MKKTTNIVYPMLVAFALGCVALLSVVPLEAQQPIAPTGTLEVAPATVVNAQPNYVMEQPAFPREIPFRPTMDRAAYDAAKAQAANDSSLMISVIQKSLTI